MKATCFSISHTPEVPVTNASKCIKHRIAGKCMTIICLLIFTMVLSGNGLAHAQEAQIIHGLSSISAPPLPLTGEAIETEEQAVAHAKAILASPFLQMDIPSAQWSAELCEGIFYVDGKIDESHFLTVIIKQSGEITYLYSTYQTAYDDVRPDAEYLFSDEIIAATTDYVRRFEAWLGIEQSNMTDDFRLLRAYRTEGGSFIDLMAQRMDDPTYSYDFTVQIDPTIRLIIYTDRLPTEQDNVGGVG